MPTLWDVSETGNVSFIRVLFIIILLTAIGLMPGGSVYNRGIQST
jgi:hypothetical protein